MRSFLIAAAFLVVAPTVANAGDIVRINRDGYKLEYQVTPQADGTRLITGHDLDSHEPFTLKVAGTRVTGDVDGRPVSFKVPEPRADRTHGG